MGWNGEKWGEGVFVVKGALDGGLGEGHSQVVVFSQVVVVEVDEGLDGFFHRSQLDQCHFAVLPVNQTGRCQSQGLSIGYVTPDKKHLISIKLN